MSTNYIDTALESYTKVIDGIINKYETAFEALVSHVDDNSEKLGKYGELLQKQLVKSTEVFNSSVKELFTLNSKQKVFFALGILGDIATPLVLIARVVADALSGVFG